MIRTLLALTLPATLLLAQAGPGGDRPSRMEPPRDPAARERLFAHLNEIRTQRIQSSLGVSASMAKSIADRWGAFDLEAHGRHQGLREARQKVQDILMGPGTEEEKNARVGPPMAQFSALQRQQRDAKEKFEGEIQKLLTPAQQGRFLLLMDDFQRRLTEVMAGPQRER